MNMNYSYLSASPTGHSLNNCGKGSRPLPVSTQLLLSLGYSFAAGKICLDGKKQALGTLPVNREDFSGAVLRHSVRGEMTIIHHQKSCR